MCQSDKRGPAAEQGNVAKDRKPPSSRYWYARRIGHVQSSILKAIRVSETRRVKRGGDREMVNLVCPQDTQPVGVLENINCLARGDRKVKRKILQKREMFKDGVLGHVKSVEQLMLKLKKVETRRSYQITEAPGPNRAGGLRLQISVVRRPDLRDCGSKEKALVKKYASRVRESIFKKVDKINNRARLLALRANERRREVIAISSKRKEVVEAAAHLARASGNERNPEVVKVVGAQIRPPPGGFRPLLAGKTIVNPNHWKEIQESHSLVQSHGHLLRAPKVAPPLLQKVPKKTRVGYSIDCRAPDPCPCTDCFRPRRPPPRR